MENYDVQELLGSGEHGAVHAVEPKQDHGSKSQLAMKTVTFDNAQTADTAMQAGQIMAELKHPHVAVFVCAPFVTVGHKAQLHFVMKRYTGDLYHYLRAAGGGAGKTGWARGMAAQVMWQVAQGLHYLHTHKMKIVHRNVKPQNILYEMLGSGSHQTVRFVLAELRVSKDVDSAKAPVHMAPEQCSGGSYDAKADMWGLGVTVCCAVLSEDERTEFLDNLKVHHKKALRKLEAVLHARLGNILTPLVLRLLRWDSEGRPTAWELLEELCVAGGGGECMMCGEAASRWCAVCTEDKDVPSLCGKDACFEAVHSEQAAWHEAFMVPCCLDGKCEQPQSPVEVRNEDDDKRLAAVLQQLEGCTDPWEVLRAYGVGAVGWEGETPLHAAAHYGKVPFMVFLIDRYGQDPAAVTCGGKSVLHAAAQGGSVEAIEYLIGECKVPFTGRVHSPTVPGAAVGLTILHSAAYGGSIAAIDYLIARHGFKATVVTGNGSTILHSAAQGGSIAAVDHLIVKYGIRPTVVAHDGYTILHSAAFGGSIPMIDHLITRHGLKHTVIDADGSTILHSAARGGAIPAIDHLIQKYGMSPTAVDNDGYTPLHSAARGGAVRAIDHLVENGADPMVESTYGYTILHSAARGGRLSAIDHIIEKYGIQPSAVTQYGYTVLHAAALEGRVMAIDHLIEKYGMDPKVVDNNNYTILHSAAQGGHVAAVDHLIEKYGIRPGVVDDDGSTVLHAAAQGGDIRTIDRLTEGYGIEPSVVDDNGATVLHAAAAGGHIPAVDHLIKKYRLCPYSVKNNGQTLLHSAAEAGQVQMIDHLVSKHGIMPTVVDNDGATALHAAAIGGSIPAIKRLIEKHKVSPCIVASGVTAAEAARSCGNEKAAEVIEKHCPRERKNTHLESCSCS